MKKMALNTVILFALQTAFAQNVVFLTEMKKAVEMSNKSLTPSTIKKQSFSSAIGSNGLCLKMHFDIRKINHFI